MQHVDVDGYNIAYRRKGRGSPVLLVHGVASHSFLWEGIQDRLANHFDVIATDLLGCGASAKPVDIDYSIVAQADILIKVIEELDITPVHLVGHDVGGGIVQIMAVKRPDLFVDLTMLNPVGYDYWPVQPITVMRLPIIRSFTASIMNPNMFRMIIRRGIYYKERLDNELFLKFWQPLKEQQGKDGFVNLIRCINNQLLLDISDDLKQIALPCLIMRGDADAYLSSEITERLAADIPGSRLMHIETGGHFMQLDEPDLISDALNEFFLSQDIKA